MAEDPSALVIIQEAGVPAGFKIKAAKFLLRFIAGTLGHRALQAAQDGIDTPRGTNENCDGASRSPGQGAYQ